jgi:hypothetical protein
MEDNVRQGVEVEVVRLWWQVDPPAADCPSQLEGQVTLVTEVELE